MGDFLTISELEREGQAPEGQTPKDLYSYLTENLLPFLKGQGLYYWLDDGRYSDLELSCNEHSAKIIAGQLNLDDYRDVKKYLTANGPQIKSYLDAKVTAFVSEVCKCIDSLSDQTTEATFGDLNLLVNEMAKLAPKYMYRFNYPLVDAIVRALEKSELQIHSVKLLPLLSEIVSSFYAPNYIHTAGEETAGEETEDEDLYNALRGFINLSGEITEQPEYWKILYKIIYKFSKLHVDVSQSSNVQKAKDDLFKIYNFDFRSQKTYTYDQLRSEVPGAVRISSMSSDESSFVQKAHMFLFLYNAGFNVEKLSIDDRTARRQGFFPTLKAFKERFPVLFSGNES